MNTLRIAHTGDGSALAAEARTAVQPSMVGERLRIEIDAPFAGDPRPRGAGSVPGLWKHEVVELFVFGHDGRYTEIELGPHGHWFVLRFDGVRRRVDDGHAIVFHARITGDRWTGRAEIERGLLPEHPVLCNAFRISGSGTARRYEAAVPVPGERPDFHRPDIGAPWPFAR